MKCECKFCKYDYSVYKKQREYEIEKMRLEIERMKLSLLEKKVLTYDQMKEMFGNSIL